MNINVQETGNKFEGQKVLYKWRDKVDKFFNVKQLWMCYSKPFRQLKLTV